MNILMCTDGSPSAEEAVRFGGLVARAMAAQVTLLTITRPGEQAAHGEAALRDGESLLREMGIHPRRAARTGVPAEEIVREVEEGSYDLLVLGAHGVRGMTRFLMGSTTYQLVGHLPLDTLVVRGKRHALGRVLICSAAQVDQRAIDVGGEWARAARAEVTLLHVISPLPSIYLGLPGMEEATREVLVQDTPATHYLKENLSRLTGQGVAAQIEVRRGYLPDEVFGEAARTDSDLVVVGSLAHPGVRRVIMGCTADQIVKHADRPVLVVRTEPGE